MRAILRLRALGGIDVRSVRRDPMLAWLAIMPLCMALVLRWGVPALSTMLQNRFAFDFVPYYPLVVSFFVITMPNVVGAIIGFLLLDQRDDLTITALQVTPLTLRGYLFYRAVAPMLVSIVLTIFTAPITGLVQADWSVLLVDATVSAPFAPLFALLVASIAKNKVQGFAVMKGCSVFSWPVIIAWFLPWPWELTMGFVPQYWLAKMVWTFEASTTDAWLFALVALIFQLALVFLLLRRFERVMHR